MSEEPRDDRWQQMVSLHDDLEEESHAVLPLRISGVDGSQLRGLAEGDRVRRGARVQRRLVRHLGRASTAQRSSRLSGADNPERTAARLRPGAVGSFPWIPPPPTDRASTPRPWDELPAEVAAALRPGLDALVEEVIEAVRDQVPAYRRPLEGEFGAGLRAGVGDALDQFLDLIEGGGELPARSKQIYVDFGRWEASEGRQHGGAARRLPPRRADLVAADRRDDPRFRASARRRSRCWRSRCSRTSTSSRPHRRRASRRSSPIAPASATGSGDACFACSSTGPAPIPRSSARRPRRSAGNCRRELAALVYRASSPDRVAAHLPAGSLVAAIDEVAIALIPDPRAPGRREEIERALRGRPGCARYAGRVGGRPSQRAAGARGPAASARTGSIAAEGLVAADENLAALVTLVEPVAARRPRRAPAGAAGRADRGRSRATRADPARLARPPGRGQGRGRGAARPPADGPLPGRPAPRAARRRARRARVALRAAARAAGAARARS